MSMMMEAISPLLVATTALSGRIGHRFSRFRPRADMSRAPCRIRQDEVARMIRAAKACGLSVKGVRFDGETVSVIIGESGEDQITTIDVQDEAPRLIREPQL